MWRRMLMRRTFSCGFHLRAIRRTRTPAAERGEKFSFKGPCQVGSTFRGDKHRQWELFGGGILGWTLFGRANEDQDGEEGDGVEGAGDEAKRAAEGRLKQTIRAGVKAKNKGDFDQAERLLHLALKIAVDSGSDEGVTYVYDQLANTAYERGDYLNSEKLFKEVLSRLLRDATDVESERESNRVVAISLKLAAIYADRGEDDRARAGLRFCVDAQDGKIGKGAVDEDTIALWGMAHEHYGHFLLDRKRYTQALQAFETAHETCSKLFGEAHHQSIVLLNSMGTVSMLLGDHSTATECFQKAVALSETAGEPAAEDKGVYLVNLGMARIKQGLIQEALESCIGGYLVGRQRRNAQIMEEAKECVKAAKAAQVID